MHFFGITIANLHLTLAANSMNNGQTQASRTFFLGTLIKTLEDAERLAPLVHFNKYKPKSEWFDAEAYALLEFDMPTRVSGIEYDESDENIRQKHLMILMLYILSSGECMLYNIIKWTTSAIYTEQSMSHYSTSSNARRIFKGDTLEPGYKPIISRKLFRYCCH